MGRVLVGWPYFPFFYHHSAFTAWISPAIKAHGSSPVHTTSFPRERAGCDALPCPRLRQFLSSVPSWQSRRPSQRFQLGMHLCSCWHSNSNLLQRPGSAGEVAVTLGPAKGAGEETTRGTARLPLPPGGTKTCPQVLNPLDGNLLPSSRYVASAGMMPKPSFLPTAEGWKSNWFAGLARSTARKNLPFTFIISVSWKPILQPCSLWPYTV